MKNKNISVDAKCNITLNFPALDIPSFNWQKGGNFKIIFPVPYPIIYNPDQDHSKVSKIK